MKRTALLAFLLALCGAGGWAQKENSEKAVEVGGTTRHYVLYVPDSLAARPALVVSLHGAAMHATDRSPFRTDAADRAGCIVAYPQGQDQHFALFGGAIPGWNATGEANEEVDFLKAVIEDVAARYPIDRSRVYCCGFSNGGMMTYALSACAADLLAAFASISGYPLNEFHLRATGARPVPFLHIHGKEDRFVDYAYTSVIRDLMVARNGCAAVPQDSAVTGRFARHVYAAGEGGFPYVFMEIDSMGHNDFTTQTPEGSSAQTMWNFMSQYTLDSPCDRTLRWRLNPDADGFQPEAHGWTVNAERMRFDYGTPHLPDNGDHNVYRSLPLEAGDYELRLHATGASGDRVDVTLTALDGADTLFRQSIPVGALAVRTFSVERFTECRLTIVKPAATDTLTAFAIHARH